MQGRSRVYFVNRYFYPDDSATAQLLSDLAFGLAERGFEVHVVCCRQLYGDAAARLPRTEAIRGVYVHRLWTTRFGRRRLLGRALDYVTFYLSCFVALTRSLRRGDIVVAKTDPPMISTVVAACAWLKGAILVNWLQDIFPEIASVLGANPLPAPLNGWMRRLRDVSLRVAAINVVLGGRMREFLASQGVPLEKIRVIQNWSAAEQSSPPSTDESLLRSRLGYQHKFIVGYSGNLGRAHDYVTLLGAAEALRDEENFVFLMVGGGAHMAALKTAVAERRLDNVHFLPYQPREALSDSLGAADVHLTSLLPALEGLIVPSKFYGILSAARPVIFIGDPDGELARVIRASGCGLVVEPGRSSELAAAIRNLRQHPGQCRDFGARSRQLSLQEYSAAGAQASWIDLLNGLLARD